jgi:ribosomal protein S18 acetylase RimI-like enzyme
MVTISSKLRSSDRLPIAKLLNATGAFNAEELAIALELVDDRLALLEKSHYHFLVAAEAGETIGYTCWGQIPGTVASADIYWIATHPKWQNLGVGKALLTVAEDEIKREKRSRIYIETSTRLNYAPTRHFYQRCGYTIVAELPDYYAPGDGKAIFLKVIK